MKKLMILTATLGLLSTGLYANDGFASSKEKRSYKKSKKARLLAKKRRQLQSKRKLAAQTSTLNYSPYIHNGLKLGLATMSKQFVLTAKTDLGSNRESESAETLGAIIGYEKIKPRGWGFSVLISQFNSKLEDGFEMDQTILEGNATYGIGEKFYTYFGGNLSKLTTNSAESNEMYDEFGAGIGTQAAIGYQIAKHIGAELKYTYTLHTYEEELSNDDTLEISLTTSALQLGINGTF